MVSNELYEQAIEKIAPKLEKLKDEPFEEIIEELIHEMIESDVSTKDLMFALTYVLDPSKFFIGVLSKRGEYSLLFAIDTPQRYWGPTVFINLKADERPTDKEIRDLIKKKFEGNKCGLEVEGLIKRAEEVIDTCRIIEGWGD